MSTGEASAGVEEQDTQLSTAIAETTSVEEDPPRDIRPREPRLHRETTLPRKFQDFDVNIPNLRRGCSKANSLPEDRIQQGAVMQKFTTASLRTAGKATSTTSKSSRHSRILGDNNSTSITGSVRETRLQLHREQKELEFWEESFEEERQIKMQVHQLQIEEEKMKIEMGKMEFQRLQLEERLANTEKIRDKQIQIRVNQWAFELHRDESTTSDLSSLDGETRESRTREWVGDVRSLNDATRSGRNLVSSYSVPNALPQSVPKIDVSTNVESSLNTPFPLSLERVPDSVTNNNAYEIEGNNAVGKGRVYTQSTGWSRQSEPAVVSTFTTPTVNTRNPEGKVRSDEGTKHDTVRFKVPGKTPTDNEIAPHNFTTIGYTPRNVHCDKIVPDDHRVDRKVPRDVPLDRIGPGDLQADRTVPYDVSGDRNVPSNRATPAPGNANFEGPRTYVEARLAQDVVKLPKFSSGDVEDYMNFRRTWKGSESVLQGLTEAQKYNRLLEQLGGDKEKGPIGRARRHSTSPVPYSDTWAAFDAYYARYTVVFDTYWRPLATMKKLVEHDHLGFYQFCHRVKELTNLLVMYEQGVHDLRSASHGTRLLEKLSGQQSSHLRKYAKRLGQDITLSVIAEWLPHEQDRIGVEEYSKIGPSKSSDSKVGHGIKKPNTASKPAESKATIYATETTGAEKTSTNAQPKADALKNEAKGKPLQHKCLFCENTKHTFGQCLKYRKSSLEARIQWFKKKERCPKCAYDHQAQECKMKLDCMACGQSHLTNIHDVIMELVKENKVTICKTKAVFADRTQNVLSKIVRAVIHGPHGSEQVYILLDDGANRTLLLRTMADKLGIKGSPEVLKVQTVAVEPCICSGQNVSFEVSALDKPEVRYAIRNAYSVPELCLPGCHINMTKLKEDWPHLRSLPALPDGEINPVLLIASDNVDLVSPISYRLGPPGVLRGVRTLLGWSIQGQVSTYSQPNNACVLARDNKFKCLATTAKPLDMEGLHHMVERLWKLDSFSQTSEKEASRSRQDKRALSKLELDTDQEEVNGIPIYCTPLLWIGDDVKLHSEPKAVIPRLRSFERKCARDPRNAEAFEKELEKLVSAGQVRKLTSAEISQSQDRIWYIPYHVVWAHDKARLVFDCSFEYDGVSVNGNLQPGPTLCSSLLGVILRFRQYPVAVSADVRAMFHQIRLKPEDRAVFRFVWRGLQPGNTPEVYEWQVLPFGATCSPCCASFALLKHTRDFGSAAEIKAVEEAVYVDNLLASCGTAQDARQLIQSMIATGAKAGFEWRKVASNSAEVMECVPSELQSDSYQLSLDLDSDSQEPALGLRWDRREDKLVIGIRYKERDKHTKRSVLQDLASYSFDPPGFLTPFTVRAKVIMQDLWKQQLDWDEEISDGDVKNAWMAWREELRALPEISVPRCYTPHRVSSEAVTRTLHIFCDAAERIYGAVAYLVTDDGESRFPCFVMARSRVAPKRQLSMPRLELSAALVGAQLTHTLHQELTLSISHTHLWSDSMTVLAWLKSDSQRFKVFVGTRVAEIQNLTDGYPWHYVESGNNVADDITRGKPLVDLAEESRWFRGPAFLLQDEEFWPKAPSDSPCDFDDEYKKVMFCGRLVASPLSEITVIEDETWNDLVVRAWRQESGESEAEPSVDQREKVETALFRKVQADCYGRDLTALEADKEIENNSTLRKLSPELDKELRLIRLGGRLRNAEGVEEGTRHPIVLDGHHPITRLLIKDFDAKLHHACGSERVFAEIRRRFWIPGGRQVVRKLKHQCVECRRWRAQPEVPRMADLPSARTQIYKPAFHSTGIDCFGPMEVKVGRRAEKRWGIIFKCMTTRAVHLDLVESMDADAFLLAYNRFYPRKGVPYEILCDCGTNFKGADSELKATLEQLEPDLRRKLAEHKVRFRFNPPSAPHFGGTWEREIRAAKATLNAVLKAQTVPEPVLRTLLIDIEGILNSKPLGYVSSDAADLDPITPNMLLMGRRDPSSPPVIYDERERLRRRKWRYSQVLADQFWRRFVRYYLPMMQSREKWQRDVRNLKMGDVVMIADPRLVRAQWPIGSISEVLQGKDGRVRVVKVKVNDKIYTRPVSRIILLEECSTDPPVTHDD